MNILCKINEWVWGVPLLTLLMGTGIYLTVILKFKPIRELFSAISLVFKSKNKDNEKGISSFQAFMNELAASIGTGNIVGVACAFTLGGPGALFWMVLSSIFGMATKFVETYISLKYRSKTSEGKWAGGPMYTYINRFPGKRLALMLGNLYAFFAVFASLGMGNMTQANSIGDALFYEFNINKIVTGIILTGMVYLIISGGIGKIARINNYLVPFMGIFYVTGCLIIILINFKVLPGVISVVMKSAFCNTAFSGGLFGFISKSKFDALRIGVSRGCFSNEAGLGATGISASGVDNNDIIKQSYISMTGVFIDTTIMCLISGLCIGATGVVGLKRPDGSLYNGFEIVDMAFRKSFGDFGGYFLSIAMVLFAFATILAWEYQGETSFLFFFRKNIKSTVYKKIYRMIYVSLLFAGVILSLDAVWCFSDICNGLMAVPNLILVLFLSAEVKKDIEGIS